ncbi:MAG TPA: CHAT domain-containing protein [Candidatus Dormibacteraeota bacterium]|nr:CHAT domain-containing protein [Candidatus Dormibacteraeota bacterium]
MNQGGTIDNTASESYAELALQEWVLKEDSENYRSGVNRLAKVLLQNHGDRWLIDFEKAPHPSKAVQLLVSAQAANYGGEYHRAMHDALLARDQFRRYGNVSGATRSLAAYIYALRRQSKAYECVQQLAELDRYLSFRKYKAMEVEAAYAHAICEEMRSNFDSARMYARQSIELADAAKYPSLELFARSAESVLSTSEGRTAQSWRIDSAGLADFWTGTYRAERAFQFYSDLQEASAHQGLWRLTLAMQREAVSMLGEIGGRFDFKAIAYFRLGVLYLKNGDSKSAEWAFSRSESIFHSRPESKTTQFYRAYLAIERSRIEAEQGQVIAAEERLKQIRPLVERINNFVVLVPYYQASAEVNRKQNRPPEEAAYLQRAIQLNQKAFHTLRTEQDRWQQLQEMDGTYHRLLELRLQNARSATSTFQDWETYRALQFASTSRAQHFAANASFLASRVNSLQHSTVISFAVFPDSINVWIADNRGIHRVSIPAGKDSLEAEIERFSLLCSDPDSSLEKVNSLGFRLYKMLIDPIEPLLEPGRVLIIEGEGTLNRMPWAALSTSDSKQLYLGDRYTIVNSPGLFYSAPSRSRARLGRAVVVYPGAVTVEGRHYETLPNAEDEVNYILRLLPQAVPLKEGAATTTRVLSEIRQSSLFHFAGHAETGRTGGELLLRDGALSASMLHNSTLSKSPLVVLSACSTGVAAGDPSRDPNGLVRAFLAAGATQVVATQWDVDSQASFTFSKNFYASLRKSPDVATAVSQARRATRSDPAKQHPFYWGAFEVFGATEYISK